jgi:hypothetical protein
MRCALSFAGTMDECTLANQLKVLPNESEYRMWDKL